MILKDERDLYLQTVTQKPYIEKTEGNTTWKGQKGIAWGNAKGGAYSPGWYQIQVVHNLKVIGQQYVYIK